jgi:hypothetical protein
LHQSSFGHAHHTYHHVACIYSELGETEKAIGWLEKSIDSGNPCWAFFRIDPYLENCAGNPDFSD